MFIVAGAVVNHQNYESSDTESANVESHKKKRFDNLKSIFKKKPEASAEVDDEADVEAGDTDEEDEDEVTTPTEGADGKKDGIVYAELDLVKSNAVKPIVKKEDEKTEYAEIIYTKNEASPKKPNDHETN